MKDCVECHVEFTPLRREQFVCSIRCRNAIAGRSGKKRRYVKCATCGIDVFQRDVRTKFCSISCRARFAVLPRPRCEVCGARANLGRRFCSRDCVARSQRKITHVSCEECGELFVRERRVNRFCSRACAAKFTGRAKRVDSIRTFHGYVHLYRPGHPTSTKAGYTMEHRMIAYDVLGGIEADDVVHHINGVRHDNRLNNLVVMSKAEHDALPKAPKRPIKCPHCGEMIRVSARVRKAERL